MKNWTAAKTQQSFGQWAEALEWAWPIQVTTEGRDGPPFIHPPCLVTRLGLPWDSSSPGTDPEGADGQRLSADHCPLRRASSFSLKGIWVVLPYMYQIQSKSLSLSRSLESHAICGPMTSLTSPPRPTGPLTFGQASTSLREILLFPLLFQRSIWLPILLSSHLGSDMTFSMRPLLTCILNPSHPQHLSWSSQFPSFLIVLYSIHCLVRYYIISSL